MRLLFVLALLGVGLVIFHQADPAAKPEEPYVNVYNWYGAIDPSLLQEFEQETGIKVRYDCLDSNDVLDAKVLAGHSGYDVVFPSVIPYMKAQIEAGAYQPIDRAQLPNWQNIDPFMLKAMQAADPVNKYSIPYLWGTYGVAYIKEKILARMPNAPLKSLRLLFDPAIVSRFSDCGVTLLEEAHDVYPQVLTYLGTNPNSGSLKDLHRAQAILLKIRPYARRFSSSRFAYELIEGDSCLAQAWSGDIRAAQNKAKESGKDVPITYVIPEEGSILWIDGIGIPKDAPHPQNALKFINFLLKPEVSARISSYNGIAIANRYIKNYLSKEIANNPMIYPGEEMMEKLCLEQPKSLKYERARTRLWAKVRFTNSKSDSSS